MISLQLEVSHFQASESSRIYNDSYWSEQPFISGGNLPLSLHCEITSNFQIRIWERTFLLYITILECYNKQYCVLFFARWQNLEFSPGKANYRHFSGFYLSYICSQTRRLKFLQTSSYLSFRKFECVLRCDRLWWKILDRLRTLIS